MAAPQPRRRRPRAAPPPGAARVLVTGGSRGIGAAVSRRFAAAGHPVIVNYRRDEAACEAVVAGIRESGGEAVACCFDVADPDATRAGLERLGDDPRPILVVINNAGVTRDAPFPAMDHTQWSRVIDTTLGGFFHVTRALVMPMIQARWGRIISMSSVSALRGNRGQTNYAAAKAGILGATRSLAIELGPRNITVNAVAPGVIDTEMTAGVPEFVVDRIAMRRFGHAREVAELVAFLASDRAAYITGQVVGVDGGFE